MSLVRRFYDTTIGKKVVMAVSGLVMVGFVIGHMLGNLKFFFPNDPRSGQYAIDHYAEYLRAIGQDLLGHGNFLWLARVALVAAVVLHFTAAFQLAKLNRAAKPRDYAVKRYRSATAASRTMLYGGILLLIFIVFHILHFTTGTVHTEGFAEGRVYANVYNGFSLWYIVAFYAIAMAALCLHLYHGVWSMFQTLGVDTPHWNAGLRNLSKAAAIILFFGFLSLPVASFFRLVAPPAPAAAYER